MQVNLRQAGEFPTGVTRGTATRGRVRKGLCDLEATGTLKRLGLRLYRDAADCTSETLKSVSTR
jgi:hypothetical protein